VRSLHPPPDALAEGDGSQQECEDPGRSLYQGHREPTACVVECLKVAKGPEVPTQDAEGEHAYKRHQAHCDPEPRA
jgi:hypothetical protein